MTVETIEGMALLPCPFCGLRLMPGLQGDGRFHVDERRLRHTMNGPGALISVEIRHWCGDIETTAHRRRMTMTVVGRDHEDAQTQWNARVPS